MRKWRTFTCTSGNMRSRLSEYARHFSAFAFLNSCENVVYGKPDFDLALAAGVKKSITCQTGNAFESLKSWMEQDHCFGFFGYDLKNEIEDLRSEHPDHVGFADMIFFIPEILIFIRGDQMEIGLDEHASEDEFHKIRDEIALIIPIFSHTSPLQLRSRISKENYISTVECIREHIRNGDIYEMNFCQEFFAENIAIDPHIFFEKLCDDAKAPFSVLFKWENQFLISASPERFLKKTGDRLISQPIKGTSRRGINEKEDALLKEELRNSIKNKAENVMIVDLVRNDLTRSAVTGSIQVPELFGIYTFERVHQMVSTITAIAHPNIHPVDIIRNAFPMGSMTGAPKVKVMELIEQYERTKRGVYSGAFGYFTPTGDFDFNVVIRSILYHAGKKYLSVQVGGAIVYDSVPEEEYAECLVKLNNVVN